ncbi:MAG: hypothetical protein Tsb0033_02120 [Winogradskyella sp.]
MFSLLAVVVFTVSFAFANVNEETVEYLSIESVKNVISDLPLLELENTFLNLETLAYEEDGLLCKYLAGKAREKLEELEVFSEEALDKIEAAIEAICDELT